VFTRFF